MKWNIGFHHPPRMQLIFANIRDKDRSTAKKLVESYLAKYKRLKAMLAEVEDQFGPDDELRAEIDHDLEEDLKNMSPFLEFMNADQHGRMLRGARLFEVAVSQDGRIYTHPSRSKVERVGRDEAERLIGMVRSKSSKKVKLTKGRYPVWGFRTIGCFG